MRAWLRQVTRVTVGMLFASSLGCSRCGSTSTLPSDPKQVEKVEARQSPGVIATAAAAPDATNGRYRQGFTGFQPSPDTKIYFVSSQGNDANDGLSPETPLLSPEAALALVRQGAPDWILFRRGDAFAGLGQLTLSGRSMKEPLLFGSYGESTERPRFLTGFNTKGSRGSPESIDYLAFVGLHFYQETADPDHPSFQGEPTGKGLVGWLQGSRGLWIEDCVFQNGQISFQAREFPISDLTLYRSQLIDAYDIKGKGQGIFANKVERLTIDECLLDHNGWEERVPGADASIYNHNVYVQTGSRNPRITESIVMRASSHGIQFRSGGVVEDNFFFQNPINVLIGGAPTDSYIGEGIVRRNVILEGVNMHSGERRGFSIQVGALTSGDVSDNIVADCKGTQCRELRIEPRYLGSNFVQAWGKGSEEGPVKVTLLDYAKTLGMKSLDEFYLALRQQSFFHYREELTARSINRYFREKLLN